jgi:trigger factor
VEPLAAEESQIDSQIEYLRERFAQIEPVEDRGIEPGDFAVISFTGYVDDEGYENNTVEAYLYELGRGQMPTEFDDALLGARPGDEITAEFPIPDTSTKPEFVGRTARFEIKVSEVKAKVLPEIDDEFAGSVGGFESVDALRADIRKRLEAAKEESRTQAIELEARKALAERLEGEVPEALRTERRNDMFADLERNLSRQNMTFEEYCRLMGVKAADVEEDLRKQAEQAVAEDLALEALYRLKDLELAPDALDEELARMATTYEMEPDQVRETFVQRGMLPVIRLELMHRAAVAWLFDNVEVLDKAPEAPAEAPADEPEPAKKSGTKKKKQDAAEATPETEAAAGAGEPAESVEPTDSPEEDA